MSETTDPMQSAMETELRPRTYFGQVQTQAYYAALVKKVGKVPFDPNQHSTDQRVTAIEISISPLPGGPIDNPIDRELIAESSDWTKVIKPSLLALSTDLRSINGKWAQVQLIPVGTYTKKDTGEEKTRTMFKFVALYDTEDACRAASDAFFHKSDAPAPTAAPAPVANGNNAERAAAAKFLAPLWNASGKDITKFATMIANQPPLAKHFDINSAEVAAVINS